MSGPTLLHRHGAGGAYVYPMETLTWQAAGPGGLKLKPVYADERAGKYLGLVAFEPMTRSGLHQHRDVAISWFLSGSLDDHQGRMQANGAGINLLGATHDAISWTGALLAARQEGPVVYPTEAAPDLALHKGGQRRDIVLEMPASPPDINVTLGQVPPDLTGIAGITRRVMFDYAKAGKAHRFCHMTLRAGAALPAFTTVAALDLFLLAGDMSVDGNKALGGAFVVIEPGSAVSLSSAYGCALLAWSEGPVSLAAGPEEDPFGF